MQGVLSIAANTIREGRRQKVFYAILFFAIAMILFGVAVSGMSIEDFDRILHNVGSGAISLFGVLLAIFLGVGMVSREVDRKTVYTIVTKPIRRSSFILGKFLGLMGILAVVLVIMLACHLAVLYAFADSVALGPLVWHVVLTLMQLAVLVAFAILMSTFTTPALSAFCTVGIYLIGSAASTLYYFGMRSDLALGRWLTQAIYYGLPNLERFNVTHSVTYAIPVDPTLSALAVLYGALYCGAFLIAASVIFELRDLK